MPLINHKVLAPFAPVFSFEGRYIDLVGGRGGGRSHFATSWIFMLLTGRPYFRGFLVRRTLNDIRLSSYRDLKDRIELSGLPMADFHFNDTNYSILHVPTGNTITSKGTSNEGSRTANLKSLAGATHVFIEEADELEMMDFDQLDLSIRTDRIKNVQIIRAFNPPPKRHWIWRDYQLTESEIPGWYRYKVRPDAGILSIFTTYKDNINNLNASNVASMERFAVTNPDYYNNMILGLVSEGGKGRIYSGWQLIEPCDHEEHCRVYGSVYVIDFGYSNDPNALIQVASHNRDVYVRELLYEPGMDNLALAKRMINMGITYRDEIYADYGAGGDVRIAELIRGYDNIEGYPELAKGFNVHPVQKTEIAVGINIVKGYNIHYTTDSRNIDTEYQEYKWALDKSKEPVDKPVDKFNHLMDCIRYYCIILGRL